tara:strand:+ start:241 stop:1077 length:837 start_codon:yes stop_codon:yes gene_type:complete
LPKAFFGSISSDIAHNIAIELITQGWEVEGTYRQKSSAVELLISRGASLFKLDFNNTKEIDSLFDNKEIAKDWKLAMISPSIIGKTGVFDSVAWEDWYQSFQLNSISQFKMIHKILSRRAVDSNPLLWLWGGPGTNNAPKEHSALILAKIAQIKLTEILNEEYIDLIPIVVGPGWVKTKTHDEVLKMGEKAGYKYFQVVDRLKKGDFTSIEMIINFMHWILKQKKEIIGGRNFSIRSDIWGDINLENTLRNNKDAFKLRRYMNDWRPGIDFQDNFEPK